VVAHFSDVSPDAIDCAEENVGRFGLVNSLFEQGSLLQPFAGSDHDMIMFNPPFLPSGLGFGDIGPDIGGVKGWELAVAFAKDVRERLAPGGCAIVGLADYGDHGHVHKQMVASFGAQNVITERRTILYPTSPANGWPAAYEVNHSQDIERACEYHFERLDIGGQEFVSFEMRHYVAFRQ
jgi:hypothetical protein